MASYHASSGFADLDGECDIVGKNCTKYVSTTKGIGTITNKPGPNLHFHVQFSGVSHPYVIHANVSGSGYNGTAKDQEGGSTEENWSATAVSVAASGQNC